VLLTVQFYAEPYLTPVSYFRWEVDENYCKRVKAVKLYNPSAGPRLLDLIDAAIFDFLIDNGDRHHYDVFENVTNSMVLLLDNGKGWGQILNTVNGRKAN